MSRIGQFEMAEREIVRGRVIAVAGPMFESAKTEEEFLAASDQAAAVINCMAAEEGWDEEKINMAYDLLQEFMTDWDEYYAGRGPKPPTGGPLALLKKDIFGFPLWSVLLIGLGGWYAYTRWY